MVYKLHLNKPVFKKSSAMNIFIYLFLGLLTVFLSISTEANVYFGKEKKVGDFIRIQNWPLKWWYSQKTTALGQKNKNLKDIVLILKIATHWVSMFKVFMPKLIPQKQWKPQAVRNIIQQAKRILILSSEF